MLNSIEWLNQSWVSSEKKLLYGIWCTCGMSRLQRCDKETHPPIPIFSLTTVALTNSIRTFSELPGTTCCYQGNRGSRQSVMHHQRTANQTACCESLKAITATDAEIKTCGDKSCTLGKSYGGGNRLQMRVNLTWARSLCCRKATQLMWSGGNEGWDASVWHFPREMRDWNIWR